MKTCHWLLVLFLAGNATAEPAAIETAAREGLPVESVRTLIAEGRAKKVPEAELDAAVQRRLAALRSAKALLQETGYMECPAAQRQGLMAAVAQALESRLSESALRETLQAGGGSRMMRIQAIVEAGESLQLLGVDGATAATLMQDFAGRDLGRGEILRAVQFITQQHRAGMTGPQIRESLWNRPPVGPACGTNNNQPQKPSR
jgi:hypothetical protein